jgi:hypothetical protein
MEQPEHLHIDVRPLPSLEGAIDRWLAARKTPKPLRPTKISTSTTRPCSPWSGVAERFTEAADTPGAFEWFRRGLIAPEEEPSW